jgi:hypothetical protein
LRLGGGGGRRGRFFAGAKQLRRHEYFVEPEDDLPQGDHDGAAGQGRRAADKQAPPPFDLDDVPAAGHGGDPANHEGNAKRRYAPPRNSPQHDPPLPSVRLVAFHRLSRERRHRYGATQRDGRGTTNFVASSNKSIYYNCVLMSHSNYETQYKNIF